MVMCHRNIANTACVIDQEADRQERQNICLFTLNMSCSKGLAVCSSLPDLYIRLASHHWVNRHTRSQTTVCSYTNSSKIKVYGASHNYPIVLRPTDVIFADEMETFTQKAQICICKVFSITFEMRFGLNGWYPHQHLTTKWFH